MFTFVSFFLLERAIFEVFVARTATGRYGQTTNGGGPKSRREYEIPRLGGAISSGEYFFHVPAEHAVNETVHDHEHDRPAKVHGVVYYRTRPNVLELKSFALLLVP